MTDTKAAYRCLLAAVAAAAIILPQPVYAERVPVEGVEKTPISLCVVATMKFVHHTRKALKFPGDTYCRPDPKGDEWDVVDVQAEGQRLYWRVPFAAAPAGEPDLYGKGDVFCTCAKR